LFRQNNRILYNLRWIQWGLIKVQDIWNTTSNRFLSKDELLQKLRSKNIFPEFRSFGVDYHNILTILQRILLKIDTSAVPSVGPAFSLLYLYDIGNKFPSSSFFYRKLIDKQFPVTAPQTKNYLTGDKEKSWLKWWHTLFDSEVDRKIKDFQWKLTYDCLSTGEKLHSWFPTEPSLCQLCKTGEENSTHLFHSCPFVKDLWTWLGTLFGIEWNEKKEHFVFFNDYATLDSCQFYITIEAKYCIWLYRNSVKFKGIDVSLQSLKFNLKYQLESHMTTLFNSYKNRNNAVSFKKSYMKGDLFEMSDSNRVRVRFFP
ncbi:MAG: zinc-binding domain-containing protein, partial [Candidatus Omnitrophica bacterium]|nr:zinc-binding domain-containing protein [Candidatus Omnitrophota bacterium]